MSSGGQQAVENEYSTLAEQSLPPPVPPRSQPATGSLFTTGVPNPSNFISSFPPTSSVPVGSHIHPGFGSHVHPGFGSQAKPSYPPDPLLGSFCQKSQFAPAVPPRTYMTADVNKQPSAQGPRQLFSSLGGAYQQPLPQRMLPPARHSQSDTPINSKGKLLLHC